MSFSVGSSFLLSGVSAQQPTVVSFPPIAQGCVAFNEITTNQPIIRKKIVRGNENTDFGVTTGKAFASFTVQIIPENTANYQVKVNLKYNDGTASEVFSDKVDMTRMKVFSLPVRSPIQKQPYQINVVVDGPRHNVYDLQILGCSQ